MVAFFVSVSQALFPFFFFNDTATTEIYTLSLHDALPIFEAHPLEQDAAQHLEEVGERQQQPHPLEHLWHRLPREHEAREQDVRQYEEEADLHRLLLSPDQRRDEQAEREARDHEDQRDRV